VTALLAIDFLEFFEGIAKDRLLRKDDDLAGTRRKRFAELFGIRAVTCALSGTGRCLQFLAIELAHLAYTMCADNHGLEIGALKDRLRQCHL
jgi:hypothetical protein